MVAPRARRHLRGKRGTDLARFMQSGQRARVNRMSRRLESAYGRPGPGQPKDPLSELIFTVLSQNTSDLNRDRAWASMWEAFASWEEIARAPRARLRRSIRVGGLSATKSRVIQEILLRVRSDQGGHHLEALRRMTMDEVEAYLREFRGVGLKTIRCVQVFSLGQPAFPVDTHIHRITRRLGLAPAVATPEVVHRIMQAITPPQDVLPFHINLITLGRRVCKPAKPRCPECVLRALCRYGRHAAASMVPGSKN